MKRDRYTEYATAAFRDYAASRLTAAERAEQLYEQNIKNAAEHIGIGAPKNNVGAAISYAEEAKADYAAYIADMEAVEKTLDYLKSHNKQYIIFALKNIYMTDPKSRITPRIIGQRVRWVATKSYCDTRTVYKWLKQARRLFAEFRGLNPGEVVYKFGQ